MSSGPIFVVGVPRSGTTLVSSVLSKHSSIHISPETHYLAHDWRTNRHLNLSNRRDRSDFIDGLISGRRFRSLNIPADKLRERFIEDDSANFRSIFDYLMSFQAREAGKPISGEKTPGHYEHIGDLLSWYPAGRVIFVLRDPRAVVASVIDDPIWKSPRHFSREALGTCVRNCKAIRSGHPGYCAEVRRYGIEPDGRSSRSVSSSWH